MTPEFENWLRFEKRSAENTVVSYISDLNQFNSFLHVNYPGIVIEKVNKLIIKSWIVSLMDKKFSPTSVNRKIVSLNTFYKFLLKETKIDKNPVSSILSPKRPHRIVKYLEEEEIIKILDELEFGDDFEGVRDKLIIEMLYGTGVRLSELIGMKAVNLEVQHGIVKVLGKRNKERIIPLNQTLIKLLQEYIIIRETVAEGKDTEKLFLTANGKPLYAMLVYRVVKKYVDQLIMRTHVSPHVLRHTFATHLINRGADINAIKALLGHANLAATQIYTHNTVERLKKVHKQAHPRG